MDVCYVVNRVASGVYDLFDVFFSSRRRHTRCYRDWSSDVCSSDLAEVSPVKAVASRAFPVLLICDEKDVALPCRHSEMIYAAARGPKQLWKVPGAFHSAALGFQPEEFKRRVLSFFATYANAPAPTPTATPRATPASSSTLPSPAAADASSAQPSAPSAALASSRSIFSVPSVFSVASALNPFSFLPFSVVSVLILFSFFALNFKLSTLNFFFFTSRYAAALPIPGAATAHSCAAPSSENLALASRSPLRPHQSGRTTPRASPPIR